MQGPQISLFMTIHPEGSNMMIKKSRQLMHALVNYGIEHKMLHNS